MDTLADPIDIAYEDPSDPFPCPNATIPGPIMGRFGV